MADDAEQEYVVEDAGKKTQADYEKDLAERERKAQEGLNMYVRIYASIVFSAF